MSRIYIHQNPNNANLSALANNFKSSIIMKHQMALVQQQKDRLQQIVENTKDGKEIMQQSLEKLQQTMEQVTDELQTVGFSGVLNRAGKVKISPQELQQRLDKEAATLEKYYEVIEKLLLFTEGKTAFSPSEIKRLETLQINVQQAITMLRSKEPIEDYQRTLGIITGIAADAIGTLSEYRGAQLMRDFGFEVILTGDKAGTHYKTMTSDMQIVFRGLDISQLGISMKRTRKVQGAKSVHAKVKTATFLSLLQGSEFPIDYNSLYNVIANHNRRYLKLNESQGQGQDIPDVLWQYSDFSNLLTNLHKAFLLTSLAGDLNDKDFASYIASNDKIYNILDLVSNYFSRSPGMGQGQSGVSINSTIASAQKDIVKTHTNLVIQSLNAENYQDAAELRSASVQKAIDSMSIIVRVRLSLQI